MIQQGAVDIVIATMTHTRERDKVVDFSITYFVTGQRILVPVDSTIETIEDLAGKRVEPPEAAPVSRTSWRHSPTPSSSPMMMRLPPLWRCSGAQWMPSPPTKACSFPCVRTPGIPGLKWCPYFSTEPFGIAMPQNEFRCVMR